MLVPVEALIDGVVRTLLEAVLPDVTSRFARGQLWTAVDVLRNLRDRIEPKAALAEAEAASIAVALDRVLAVVPGADTVATALAAAPAEPPVERAAALRAALVAALELVDRLPSETAEPARRAIAEHLASQTIRDLMVLKPSLLTEISKG